MVTRDRDVQPWLLEPGDEFPSRIELDARAREILAHRLEAASEVFRQKRLHDRGERAAVLRSSESMTLVGIKHVGDGNAALLHGRADLLGFRGLHPYVVG